MTTEVVVTCVNGGSVRVSVASSAGNPNLKGAVLKPNEHAKFYVTNMQDLLIEEIPDGS